MHDAVRCTVHEDFSDVATLAAADAVVAYTCDVRPTAEQADAFVRSQVTFWSNLVRAANVTMD